MGIANPQEYFFFGTEQEAGLYDSTIELVAPLYNYAHQTILEVFKRCWPNRLEALQILDIGSGTGAESLSLMEVYPESRIVALDLMPAMHDRFRDAFGVRFPGVRFEDRVTPQTRDVAEVDDLVELNNRQPYHAIVSAFAIHHLPTAQKVALYTRCFNALRPGGLLVNTDLYSYQSDWFRSQAHEFDVHWMETHFRDPGSNFPASAGVSPEERERLLQLWIEHYNDRNRLDPIECPCLGRNASERAAARSQAAMLARAGFTDIAWPFRYWQVGVLVGIRPQ